MYANRIYLSLSLLAFLVLVGSAIAQTPTPDPTATAAAAAVVSTSDWLEFATLSAGTFIFGICLKYAMKGALGSKRG